MLQLTKLSLRRPVSVFMIVLALILFGFSAMFTTPLELIPNIEMPMMVVVTTYPGAAPQDMESLVTTHLEKAASTLNGIKYIQSISSENLSLVMLEMEYGTDMDEAHSDLKNNLEMYSMMLPDEASKPTVIELNVSTMMPTIVVSATAQGDIDLRHYVEQEIQPEFEKLGGVASIDLSGGQQDYISVTLREEMLTQYNLSMDTLVQMLKSADFSLPAGSIRQGDLDLTLRGGVSYPSTESLRDIPITLSTGDVVRLSDVADITESTVERTSLSRDNGVEDVSMTITKRQSASTFAVTNAVQKAIKELNARDLGLTLRVVYNSSDMIMSSITAVGQTLLYGILLAMAVLFIFFGDWRASLIVGSSIPVSLLVTLIAMNTMGFSFNILSLGGLVIGVGMMVDNSIVVLESCFRCKGAGRSLREGAQEGTRVVASSIVASTLTTVVVFLPMAFISGMSGQLFGQLCFTIVFSLVASLISALTLVPLVFYRLSPTEKTNNLARNAMSHIETAYAMFLPKTLNHKGWVVVIAVALLIVSFVMVPFIDMELLPATDDGIITIEVSARPGLRLDKLDEILRPLEEMVDRHPDVDRYSLSAGGGGMMSVMMGGSSSSATLTAYLREDHKVETSVLVDAWRAQTADVLDCDINVSASSTTSAMTGGSDIAINLQGTDIPSIERAALQVEELMRADPNILRVSSSVSSGNPQAEIVIDPVKSGALGLIPAQVMGSVYTMMEGAEAATLHQDGRDYSIRVEYPKDRFASISDLAGMTIPSPTGMRVPLLDIASIEYSSSPQSITSLNGRYLVIVTGQPSSSAAIGTLSADLDAKARRLDLPIGVEVTNSAQLEEMAAEFGALLQAILVAVFLVFMVMTMQFESPRFAIVVMLCVPFALIGSFGLLLVTRATLSMPSLMGFLMLVGIVVNNGILFIDTTNRLREEESLSAVEALATAGVLRMRPIFMTTLTTVLAMLPLAVGVGSNADLMRGMAMVIIGGLIASTTLTLLLLPSFYLLFDRKRVKKRRRRIEEHTHGSDIELSQP